jgi:hypothetical protein
MYRGRGEGWRNRRWCGQKNDNDNRHNKNTPGGNADGKGRLFSDKIKQWFHILNYSSGLEQKQVV